MNENDEKFKMKCSICGTERNGNSLKSVTHDVSNIFKKPSKFTVFSNIIFCNDNQDCKGSAFDLDFIKKEILKNE